MQADDSRSDSPFAGEGLHRRFYLPRLSREHYRGDAVVHWTLPVSQRRKGWLDDQFHSAFREVMLHVASREGLLCPVFCLMPDHLHLVWMGLRFDTDQIKGMAFLRTHLKPKIAPNQFQHQAHDHVLKAHERQRDAFAIICRYDLENPVRAGLVEKPGDWPYLGAIVPGYPSLHPLDESFWRRFWQIYARAKQPNARENVHPL